MFELQVSQLLILPMCPLKGLQDKVFIGDNGIFCLQDELSHSKKIPKIPKKMGRFSLFCSILSAGWATKSIVKCEMSREGKHTEVLSSGSHPHLINDCEVAAL